MGSPLSRRDARYDSRIAGVTDRAEKGTAMAHGSIPTGPSDLYLRLLKGEITPKSYAKQAKKRGQEESRRKPSQTGTKPQRA